MKRKGFVLALALGLFLAASMTSHAGQWLIDDIGWWWQEDNGNYPVSTWQWIDGNKDGIAECYYFNESGYLVTSAVIEGSEVNSDGAWVENGAVQFRTVDTLGAESNTAADNGLWNELSTTFIKKKYIDLLGADRETLFHTMGEMDKVEESILSGGAECYLYYITAQNSVFGRTVYFYLDDEGKVNKISAFDSFELMDTDRTEFTFGELSTLLGTEPYLNQNQEIIWKLSDHVYYIINRETKFYRLVYIHE